MSLAGGARVEALRLRARRLLALARPWLDRPIGRFVDACFGLGGLLATPICVQLVISYWGTLAGVLFAAAAIGAIRRGRRRWVALGSYGVLALYAVPAYSPILRAPRHSERLAVETLSSRRGAYGIALGDDGTVIVTHGHTPHEARGLAVIRPDGRSFFTPTASSHVIFTTGLPGGAAIAHEWEEIDESVGGVQSRTYILDPATSTWSVRDEQTPYYRSFHFPGLGLFLILRPRHEHDKGIEQTTPERFLAGEPPLRSWRVPIEGLEELARHPTRPVIYGRGEASSRSIVELDVRYGTLRYGDGIRIWHWGIATAGPLGQVLLTNSFANQLFSIDDRTLEVKAVTPILGMPRPVTYLPTAGLAAVGAYAGRRISFLSPDPDATWTEVATLPTCQKVHALIFDEPSAYLYFTDFCGAYRVRIPPDRWWEPAEAREAASHAPG